MWQEYFYFIDKNKILLAHIKMTNIFWNSSFGLDLSFSTVKISQSLSQPNGI